MEPVPPIYQPELAVRAIAYAADHPARREYWVGAGTAATLIANAIAPGLLDRYLAALAAATAAGLLTALPPCASRRAGTPGPWP